jgi:hypothetical protein
MEFIGRMVCDGNGNLLADEGEKKGHPIAYDEDTDTFVFIKPGEPSHNERYHKQFADMVGTQSVDPELPGYAGIDAEHATEGMEHHFEENLEPMPRVKFHPDSVAHLTGGHTHQHKAGA